MSDYKHWRNCKEPGAALFVTTTVLDFVHAFRREEMRDAMVFHIARECKLARANLNAYVVMPHHVHLVIKLHERMSGPVFMQRFKKNTAEAMLRLLSEPEHRDFDHQRGLNRRQFWKYSYRGLEITGPEMFWQKVKYTHYNPVEAGYVEQPEDYRWSGAALYLRGLWCDENGLPYNEVMASVGWEERR